MSKIEIIEGYLHNMGIKSTRVTNALLHIDNIMGKQCQIRNKCNEIGNLRLIEYQYLQEYATPSYVMHGPTTEWYIEEV